MHTIKCETEFFLKYKTQFNSSAHNFSNVMSSNVEKCNKKWCVFQEKERFSYCESFALSRPLHTRCVSRKVEVVSVGDYEFPRRPWCKPHFTDGQEKPFASLTVSGQNVKLSQTDLPAGQNQSLYVVRVRFQSRIRLQSAAKNESKMLHVLTPCACVLFFRITTKTHVNFISYQ